MFKKITFIFSLILISFVNLYGQDLIILKDNSEIKSKVIEISEALIKYRKASNLNGPTYTISKAEILMIIYENGERELFNYDDKKQKNIKIRNAISLELSLQGSFLIRDEPFSNLDGNMTGISKIPSFRLAYNINTKKNTIIIFNAGISSMRGKASDSINILNPNSGRDNIQADITDEYEFTTIDFGVNYLKKLSGFNIGLGFKTRIPVDGISTRDFDSQDRFTNLRFIESSMMNTLKSIYLQPNVRIEVNMFEKLYIINETSFGVYNLFNENRNRSLIPINLELGVMYRF